MRGAEGHTKKIIAGILIATFVFQGVFAFSGLAVAADGPVSGQAQSQSQKAADEKAKPSTNGEGSTTFCVLGDLFCYGKDLLLWALDLINRAVILIIAAPAASLFVWVVDPANISGPSGVLNFPAIYTLWQFIRDFFNLFFIFILLFSAFATIFQVDSFNIRNIFKNILLAALLINFSYPITRFLIDAANVPMYYFINDVIGAGGGQGAVIAMNNLLGFSGTAAAAFTKDFIPTFAGIIFSFLFGISLAVLSIMMIVRLIALTLLLIFSPIGFASAMLPGFNKYGQEWWSKFWSYALFGPAAALMLVVSLKFLEATKDANVWASVNAVTTNASVDASGATMLTNTIFYTIPIILIWSTIGLANKFSMAGAATVVGLGYGASSWARKKVQNGVVRTAKFTGRTAVAPIKPVAKGISAGLKDSVQSGKWFGGNLNNVRGGKFLTGKYYKETSENMEAKWKGRVTSGSGTGELQKLESKRQYEAADEMKKNNVSNSDLLKALNGGDKAKAAAAAMVLTDRNAIKSAADFQKALEVLGKNTKEVGEMVGKVDGDMFEKLDPTDYQAILDTAAFKEDSNLKGTFEAKLKKDGEIKARIDFEVAKNRKENPQMSEADAKRKAHADVLDKLSADDLGKQSSLIQSMGGENPDVALREYFKERSKDAQFYTEAMKKMTQKDRQVFMETERVAKAETATQPGERVSSGGVIIPGGSKTA